MFTLIGFLLGMCLFFILPAYLIWFYILGGKGKQIRAKFQAAGNLRGKSIAQIEAIGGKPLTLVTQGDKQVGTWGHIGYNIILVFKGGLCQGVNKEVQF